MKVSLKWLNEYVDTTLEPSLIEEKLTDLGLECKIVKKKYEFSNKVILGKIIKINKHPNADKLNICEVDVGNKKVLSIVCGAPNVKKNIKVPVAQIGAILGDNKFKINKVTIRGETSHGMICSGKELNLNDDHDGIMIINSEDKLGTSIENIINKNNDYIYDIDLTPNRGDCLGHLGVARELSIIENKKITLETINFTKNKLSINDNVKIKVEATDSCPRYCARIIKDIEVKESPQWLKEKIESIGQKPINNVVDVANYVLNDLGHPLHTFDLDLIKNKEINIRYAKKNEKLLALDNNTYTLNAKDLIVADKSNPIALAGIIGGLNSHVSISTKNILIESAYFNPVTIRKSSKSKGISTEASKRFERDTDFEILTYAMDKAAMLIQKVSGGNVSKDYIDINLSKNKSSQISFNLDNCNSFLGANIKINELKSIFNKLSIIVHGKTDVLKCSIPSYRNDIKREVDLYEEVARVYGYNNIPSNESFNMPYNCLSVQESNLEDRICKILSTNGFNEHYSNSLYSEKDISVNKNIKSIELMNPINQDMKYLRNSLLPGLLRAVSYNEKRGQQYLKYFEIGSTNSYHSKNYNKAKEIRELGIIWTCTQVKHWKLAYENDIYSIKSEVEHLLDMLCFNNIELIPNMDTGRINININKTCSIGYISEISETLKNDYKIKNNLYYCNININNLLKVDNSEIKYHAISSYPSINRDTSFLIEKKFKHNDIVKIMESKGGEYLENISLFDIYIDKDSKKNEHSLAYSLKFCSQNRTLKDGEIDKVMNQILLSLKKKFKIVQR